MKRRSNPYSQGRSVASNADRGGQFAGSILFSSFFIALSSFYPAVDLTAGEKERGTIVTLLTTPINAIEVVAGKATLPLFLSAR